MKKYLFPLLTLFMSATMCLSLVSCGDDDNNERGKSSPLTGTWGWSYSIEKETGKRITFDFNAHTITFFENGEWHTRQLDQPFEHTELYLNGAGKGQWRRYVYENNIDKLAQTDPIEYVVNGNKVIVKYDSNFINEYKKYADSEDAVDIEEIENWKMEYVYDSEKETICWSVDGSSIYYTKK